MPPAERCIAAWCKEMSANAGIFIYESQLLRACGTPVTADHIRNPGYRLTYSYAPACAISINKSCKHELFIAAAQDFHI